MQTLNDSLARELEARVNAEIEARREGVSTGNAQDFAQYKLQCGVILGLQMALDISAQAQTDIQKR